MQYQECSVVAKQVIAAYKQVKGKEISLYFKGDIHGKSSKNSDAVRELSCPH